MSKGRGVGGGGGEMEMFYNVTILSRGLWR